MDFITLLSDNQSSSPIIEEGIDPARHTKVLTTLCEKRKMLEQAIANKEQSNDGGETVIALMQLKNDMALFGISEIDYQAYMAKDTAPKITDEVALSGNQTVQSQSLQNIEISGIDTTG